MQNKLVRMMIIQLNTQNIHHFVNAFFLVSENVFSKPIRNSSTYQCEGHYVIRLFYGAKHFNYWRVQNLAFPIFIFQTVGN